MGLKRTVPETSAFYDRWTDLFWHGFGPVFQAGLIKTGHPPREDPTRSVLALAERAGVRNGDRVLDAGCGIAGPASIIAGHYDRVSVEAVTNSPVQVTIARRLLEQAGTEARVTVHLADYHKLPFRSELFDLVMFLESTGYSDDLESLYGEAARVLRPGGRLYVKDVFRTGGKLRADQLAQMASFDALWGCVGSKSLHESEAAIAGAGLAVTRVAAMPDVGTARLAGAMFRFDASLGLRPTPMGQRFALRDLDPPIEFGEIVAIKPDVRRS